MIEIWRKGRERGKEREIGEVRRQRQKVKEKEKIRERGEERIKERERRMGRWVGKERVRRRERGRESLCSPLQKGMSPPLSRHVTWDYFGWRTREMNSFDPRALKLKF